MTCCVSPNPKAAVAALAWLVFSGGAAHAGDADVRPLRAETSIYSGPGTGLSGLLTAGTPVEVLEQQGPWIRVRVDGWVRADAAGVPAPAPAPGSAALAPPAPAPPAPAAAPPMPPAEPRRGPAIEGSVKIKVRRAKSANGAGAQVWLLPAAARAELEHEGANDTEAQRLGAIEAEIARLGTEADLALQQVSNFTEATRKRDALLGKRRAALDERQQLLAARHGRHEAQARRAAVDSAVADGRGWFTFANARLGTYTVYGRMIREGLDVEWVETVEVGAAGTAHIDLDETTARGLLREAA